jgi:predicted transcriptional regulator
MESKNAEDLKNLLLKMVLPLVFPLVGSFISDLIKKRGANRPSYRDTYDCSVQIDDPSSYGSTCQESEEQEMESTRCASRKLARSENACSTAGRLLISGFSRQASNAKELMETVTSENAAEVVVDKVEANDLAVADELATLKRLVSGLEERASSIESQFHDYCDMKEQESACQKMQIMCLGKKLELLESQNQRLGAAAVETRAAAVESAAMRGRLDRLQSKMKKMTERRKQGSDAVRERILALDAKQAQMAGRCEEFEQCMEEMRQLTLQLQEQNDEVR